MPGRSVEKVSRSHVSLAPPPISNDELQKVSRPVTDEELGIDYPTNPEINMNALPQSHLDKQ